MWTACAHSEHIRQQERRFLIRKTNPVLILRSISLFMRICVFIELKVELKSMNKTLAYPLGCTLRFVTVLSSIRTASSVPLSLLNVNWNGSRGPSGCQMTGQNSMLNGFTQYRSYCQDWNKMSQLSPRSSPSVALYTCQTTLVFAWWQVSLFTTGAGDELNCDQISLVEVCIPLYKPLEYSLNIDQQSGLNEWDSPHISEE